jgi:hypothetical protein
VSEKWCPHCEQWRRRDEFYRQAAQPDGLTPYCRACWSADCRARHARKRAGLLDKRRAQMQGVRHDYFATINSPIQAYILGLLASDGSVSSTRPRIQFSVHENDRILVEWVRDELAPTSPILLQRHTGRCLCMAKIHFTSPQMCRDLARFGIVPNKSHTLSWPDALPTTLVNSYLLGIYDGDGWVTRDRRKRQPYYTCGIVSASAPFLERASEVISAALHIPPARLSGVNRRAFSIRYGGRSAREFDRWIHQDWQGLPRKRLPGDAFLTTLPLAGG